VHLVYEFFQEKSRKRKAPNPAQGQAVAISNNLALTCLHRNSALDIVTLRSTEDGEEMTSKVVFSEFVADVVR
jgi:hypothetical protein